jgi:hypothetical protein
MTEINAQIARRSPRAFAGIISNIETADLESGKLILATLTTKSRTGTAVRTLSISGEALARVEPVIFEGSDVRLYAQEGETYVTVIGLDLTKRTLARQESETAIAPAQVEKPARVYSPAQIASHKAYGERLRKGREAAAARRAAEAQTVAA